MSLHPDPELRRRWRGLIESFDSRRSTVAEFCRRHQVSTASFYVWRRRLGEGIVPTPAFVPIRIAQAPSRSESTVRIHLPGGVRVEVPAEHRELLVELLTRLASTAGEVSR